MVDISDIQRPVGHLLEGFDRYIAEHFRSSESLMQSMIADALSSRGKGVRPLLVMLSYGLCGGSDLSRAYVSAMMCEMIHLASLIHDDVIDDAALRRGRPTLNSRWQSKRAVLAGDYILAKNLSLGMGSGHHDLVAHIVEAISRLCEGEVLQDDCAKRGIASMEEYLRVIDLKTASLLSVSASSGALAASAAQEDVEALGLFGRLLGVAFQIQDDILDYSADTEGLLGKECGQDLAEGKFTMPLLLALERCGEQARREHIISIVCEGREEEFADVRAFVAEAEGCAAAGAAAAERVQEAVALLDRFAESPYKRALAMLAEYVLQRKK